MAMYIKSDRLEIESIKAEFSKVCEEHPNT